ncbi:hypothetical protein PIB30_013196 [Stylosanthes scabra]|uniref:Uncharacterized protein n=1 Tax=Stylosanthes scabra TaxID=79078 RepID=A0ABU6Z4X2_9FABA|nr:hypothetical protein [Stylosanthes scabra]
MGGVWHTNLCVPLYRSVFWNSGAISGSADSELKRECEGAREGGWQVVRGRTRIFEGRPQPHILSRGRQSGQKRDDRSIARGKWEMANGTVTLFVDNLPKNTSVV